MFGIVGTVAKPRFRSRVGAEVVSSGVPVAATVCGAYREETLAFYFLCYSRLVRTGVINAGLELAGGNERFYDTNMPDVTRRALVQARDG